MKNLIKIFAAVLITMNVCIADNAKYDLRIAKLNYVNSNNLEFDIFLQNMSTDKSVFKYAMGQYFLNFNETVSNGGQLTLSIINSELPEYLRPVKSEVWKNQLRLSINSVTGHQFQFLEVSNKPPGILIAKVRLTTSADKFADVPLNLNWTDVSDKFKTKIIAFGENRFADITNHESHSGGSDKVESIQLNEVNEIPTEYSLSQNYPNPFNPTTKINYELPITNYVKVLIYDLTGREIVTMVNELQSAGKYNVKFDGSNFASGVYFYKITSGDFSKVMRMVLIK